jgi:hypothetical protein
MVESPTTSDRPPLTRETKLSRIELSAALRERGYRVAPSTLSTKATRGGGPPFQKFGPYSLYTWGTALDWAEGRLTDPQSSTSEDAA